MYIALDDTKSTVYFTLNKKKNKINPVKLQFMHVLLLLCDFMMMVLILANSHIFFFFCFNYFSFLLCLCCTEVSISLDFSVNVNFFMKPTIVISYSDLCLIKCFA